MGRKEEGVNLSECSHVKNLWSSFLMRFGSEKATRAIRQAIDLQNMRGDKTTVPILFVSTGGIALTTYDCIKKQTGISFYGNNKVILYCKKESEIQILHETKAH